MHCLERPASFHVLLSGQLPVYPGLLRLPQSHVTSTTISSYFTLARRASFQGRGVGPGACPRLGLPSSPTFLCGHSHLIIRQHRLGRGSGPPRKGVPYTSSPLGGLVVSPYFKCLRPPVGSLFILGPSPSRCVASGAISKIVPPWSSCEDWGPTLFSFSPRAETSPSMHSGPGAHFTCRPQIFRKTVVFMQVHPPLLSRPRPLSYSPQTPSTDFRLLPLQTLWARPMEFHLAWT